MKEVFFLLLLFFSLNVSSQSEADIKGFISEYKLFIDLLKDNNQLDGIDKQKSRIFISDFDKVQIHNNIASFKNSIDLSLEDYIVGNLIIKDTVFSTIKLLGYSESPSDEYFDIFINVEIENIPKTIDRYEKEGYQYIVKSYKRDSLSLGCLLKKNNGVSTLQISRIYKYLDSDEDATINRLDRCKFSSKNAKVNSFGCTDKDEDNRYPDVKKGNSLYDPDDNNPCNPIRDKLPCDTDGDKIPNAFDQCPFSESNAEVNKFGCTDEDEDKRFPDVKKGNPLYDPDDNNNCIPNENNCDADFDGVPDNRDKCPNKYGKKRNGCPKKEVTVFKGVLATNISPLSTTFPQVKGNDLDIMIEPSFSLSGDIRYSFILNRNKFLSLTLGVGYSSNIVKYSNIGDDSEFGNNCVISFNTSNAKLKQNGFDYFATINKKVLGSISLSGGVYYKKVLSLNRSGSFGFTETCSGTITESFFDRNFKYDLADIFGENDFGNKAINNDFGLMLSFGFEFKRLNFYTICRIALINTFNNNFDFASNNKVPVIEFYPSDEFSLRNNLLGISIGYNLNPKNYNRFVQQ